MGCRNWTKASDDEIYVYNKANEHFNKKFINGRLDLVQSSQIKQKYIKYKNKYISSKIKYSSHI